MRDLNAVSLLGATPSELTPTPDRDGVFDVAWAPAGASLIAAYVQAGSMRLAELPSGGVTRVIADLGPTSVSNLTISPDGTRAAFSGTSDIDF